MKHIDSIFKHKKAARSLLSLVLAFALLITSVFSGGLLLTSAEPQNIWGGQSDLVAPADSNNDGVFEITTAPEDFSAVRETLEADGYEFVSAEVEMVAQNYVKLEDEKDITNMEKMIDMLEDNDDVQNVWHNWDM